MTRTQPAEVEALAPEGLLVVDKAVGPTSHDVVAQVRRRFATRRVGHGGTLDPPASGVLLIALGRATRLLRFVLDLEKSYTAELVLGTATTTLDDTGAVVEQVEMGHVTPEAVVAATSGFLGTISQVPPMVSAVKIGGRRLHELARAGIEVERPAREVEVTRFDAVATADPLVYEIAVDCSSGTYVRSLAADLGAALGGVAHLRRLRRVAIGPFDVAGALPVEQLDLAALRPAAEIVGHLPALSITDETVAEVANGKLLDRTVIGASGSGPWALLDDGGRLVAVYEPHPSGRAKPVLVLAAGVPAGAAGRDELGSP